MKRRGFFKRLLGLAATPIAAKVAEKEASNVQEVVLDLSKPAAGWNRTCVTTNLGNGYVFTYTSGASPEVHKKEDDDSMRTRVLLQAPERPEGQAPGRAEGDGETTGRVEAIS